MALQLSISLRLFLFLFISFTTPLCSYASSTSLQQQPPSGTNSPDGVFGGGGGGGVAVELWCVAKNNAEDSSLQSAIDWACGPGGADCRAIQQGGPCYDPADIIRTASFAFNDYYLKNGMTEDSCKFDNTAALTSLNPSHGNCKFPSSLGMRGSSSIGTSTGQSSTVTSRGEYILSGPWVWALILFHLLIMKITLIL